MGCFPGIEEPGRRGVLRQRTPLRQLGDAEVWRQRSRTRRGRGHVRLVIKCDDW